jgi:hypothetical protein
MSIYSFAESGFWDYRNQIVSIAVGVPLAVEGIQMIKHIYQKPQIIKEKWHESRQILKHSFSIQSNEKRADVIKRIAKNVSMMLGCVSLMGGAVALSIYLLPASMSLSVAISSVLLIGKVFLHTREYKKQIVESFTPYDGEDRRAARYRILKTAIKTGVVAAAALIAIAVGGYVIIPLFSQFSWHVDLPFQTKPIVFLEYAMMGLLHLGVAIDQFRKGNRSRAIFHLTSAALSLFFPATYWNDRVMRLHHSFYGLLFMALPFRAARFLGSIVTFDSLLYKIAPYRGSPECGQYDFINSIVDHFSLFWNSYVASILAQFIFSESETSHCKRNEKLKSIG